MEKCNNTRKAWSQEDVIKLRELANRGYIIDEIAKKIGRTKLSIKKKLEKMYGTSNFFELSSTYSTVDLGKIMGYNSSKVLDWIENHNMPCRKQIGIGKDGFFYAIDFEDFLKWLKKHHKNLSIDFCRLNVELYPSPTMPDWLREEYLGKKKYSVREFWTEREEAELVHYYVVKGYTLKEISTLMNKSVKALDSKIIRMKLRQRECLYR